MRKDCVWCKNSRFTPVIRTKLYCRYGHPLLPWDCPDFERIGGTEDV